MQRVSARSARIGAPRSGTGVACPRDVILDDHARLPWRFFGRLTAAVQAGL
jgi:hypothetical protein